MILICDKGFIQDKKIYCRQTGGLCGHVKMCQLNGKWHQTPMAERCTLRKEKTNE